MRKSVDLLMVTLLTISLLKIYIIFCAYDKLYSYLQMRNKLVVPLNFSKHIGYELPN